MKHLSIIYVCFFLFSCNRKNAEMELLQKENELLRLQLKKAEQPSVKCL